MQTTAESSEARAKPPDAWKVWGAWQGGAEALKAVARQMEKHVGEIQCVVELPAGRQSFQPDDLPTGIAPRHLRSIRRIVLEGSTGDRHVEAEFDNELSRTPGRGVSLSVWSMDAAEALSIRDEIALAIDGRLGPLSGEPIAGPPSHEGVQDALATVTKKRNENVQTLSLVVVGGLLLASAFAHFVIKPESSSIADLVLFCTCNRLIFAVVSIVALTVAYFAGPRIFPPVEISEHSTWSRVRTGLWTRVAGLGIGAYVLSTAIDALDKAIR